MFSVLNKENFTKIKNFVFLYILKQCGLIENFVLPCLLDLFLQLTYTVLTSK